MNKIAFIGLGVMGWPMARHLIRAGCDVTVSTRTPDKAKAFCDREGGRYHANPATAADGAEVVITMLRDDADLRNLLFGEAQLVSALKPGATLIDHSTASPTAARYLASNLADFGVRSVDAPVSGGQAGAESGKLSVMVGCRPQDFNTVAAVVAPYSAQVQRIGSAGDGQMAKLVNQVCIAGTIQGLAEGLALGVGAGLDMASTLKAISNGAAQSWQMDNRAATMLANRFDFGFSVDLMMKDLKLAQMEASRLDLETRVADLVCSFLSDLQAEGAGRLDNSALITRLVTSDEASISSAS